MALTRAEKKLRDLQRRLQITVTQEDIDAGIPASHSCPIARAVRRQTRLRNVSVMLHINISTGNGRWRSFLMPERAIDFIQSFDGRLPVKPFSFTAEERA